MTSHLQASHLQMHSLEELPKAASLVVQCLRLHISTAGAQVWLDPGQGTKIPRVSQCGLKIFIFNFKNSCQGSFCKPQNFQCHLVL